MENGRTCDESVTGWRSFVPERGFEKFLSLRNESGRSSKQEFELFIPTSQTFQKPNSYATTRHLHLFTYAINSRLRSNQILYPTVPATDRGYPNDKIKSMVLMISWKHKPRRHSKTIGTQVPQ